MPELSIGTVKDLEAYVKLLIYGPPGVGKTTFVADAPKPIFIDFENSTETLRGGPREDIPVVRDPNQIGDSEAVLRFIRSKEVDQFETIVLDTISSMYDAFMIHWMKSPTVQKRSSNDRHIAQQFDFRKITNVLKEIFYELQYKPMNVVLIAHEKQMVDPDSNRVLEIRPQLPPAAEQSVERLINEVYYMERKPATIKDPAKRLLYVDSQGKILAKNRSRLSTPVIENPTWKEVFGNA